MTHETVREKGARLTSPQIVKIVAHLHTILEVVDEAHRVVRYVSGQDDHSVAKQFGVSHQQVSNLRVDNFGKLFIHTGERSLTTRVEALEAQNAAQQKDIDELKRKLGVFELQAKWAK